MPRGRLITVDGVASIATWPGGDDLTALLTDSCRAGGATVLATHLIRLPDPIRSKPGSPPGGTAWVGLDESHVTIHWYEHPTIGVVRFALDIFTCGSWADPLRICDKIEAGLGDVVQLTRTVVQRFPEERCVVRGLV
jgi:S-adenosylmethionine/arginine decarboxylase-like enzyme